MISERDLSGFSAFLNFLRFFSETFERPWLITATFPRGNSKPVERQPSRTKTVPGEIFASFEKAIQAEVGGSYTVTIDTAGEKIYYKFTATESKSYTIKSSGGLDTYGYLYDSSQSQLTYNDGSTDFIITRSLTAGETYYVVVEMYSSSATGTFTLTIS